MRKKLFTFLFALMASVGMSWADTYVTITQNDFPESGHSFTKDGVTVSVGSIDRWEGKLLGGGSFSTTLGNFTHIEVMAGDVWPLGEGWSGDDESQIWSGNASSVSFNGDIRSMGRGITLLFTIGDPAPTYTVALKAGTANANKVTLSATSAIEGATITVTPDEEYEITAFKAKYNTTEEAPSTLDPATGAYSFTMPAFAVTIEATIALKPVPEGDIYAGFTATAGAGGFTNEGSANLVDNKFTSGTEQVNWTKWCANDGHKSVPTGESESCWWIDFEASAALNPTGYILTTGNDTGSEHGRNPKNWVLKAKLDADDAWTTIATVTNDVTMKNKSFKDYKFFVDQSGTYQYFRFEVFANQGANVMQLCELRLIGAEPVVVTTHTLQLHVNDALMGSVALQNPSNDIVDNGDGTYTVPEGAEVTLLATPNEGYEFTGWKASSSICDFNECEFVDLPTTDNPLTVDMYMTAAFMAEFAAVAPQPVVLADCGLGWLNVPEGGVVGTIGHEDEIVLPQVNASLDFILAFQAHTATLRLGSTDESVLAVYGFNNFAVNGVGECDVYVVHDEDAVFAYDSAAFHVTVNPEPTPQPAEDVDITPNVDPENPTVYYSTFYDSAKKYALPAGVEAYVADLSGANLLLTKIAEAGEVIPADNAVILKSTVTPFTLTPSDADAVTFTATNDLQGSDTQIATPANCYVLAGTDGVVGFYHYTASQLNAHKAYVVYSGSNQAPRRMPFVFDQATGVENIQGDNVQSTKVIENGVLYIIKNGVKYNAQGQIVK